MTDLMLVQIAARVRARVSYKNCYGSLSSASIPGALRPAAALHVPRARDGRLAFQLRSRSYFPEFYILTYRPHTTANTMSCLSPALPAARAKLGLPLESRARLHICSPPRLVLDPLLVFAEDVVHSRRLAEPHILLVPRRRHFCIPLGLETRPLHLLGSGDLRRRSLFNLLLHGLREQGALHALGAHRLQVARRQARAHVALHLVALTLISLPRLALCALPLAPLFVLVAEAEAHHTETRREECQRYSLRVPSWAGRGPEVPAACRENKKSVFAKCLVLLAFPGTPCCVTVSLCDFGPGV